MLCHSNLSASPIIRWPLYVATAYAEREYITLALNLRMYILSVNAENIIGYSISKSETRSDGG